MHKWQTIIKKATASSVNCSLIFIISAPVYWLVDFNWGRVSCITLFMGYNLVLPRRCLGQMVAGTYQNLPTNLTYAALYTASFATLHWWIWMPFDLAMVNGLLVQLPCLLIFGNTAHGLLAGRKTLLENPVDIGTFRVHIPATKFTWEIQHESINITPDTGAVA